MRYMMLLALTACMGCVGEQTRQAFTLRPPARDYGPLPPNHAAEHEANLQRALERATEQQEADDGLQLKCHRQAPLPGEACTFLVCD
jgi:hypothetical protein